MSASSSFEEAASHLRQAICDNKLASLQTSDFRILIHETSSNKVPTLLQEQVLEDLLAVLSSNQLSHNNHIVAATAYCKIVSNVKQEMDKILSVFIKEFVDNQFHECSLFLCHGIFQLSCWKSPSKTGDVLLEEIFTIVKRFCCELNSTCYLAFKVLHSLLNKIHQLYPTGSGISEDNFKSVLDIALSNWENPLSGVRQQNSLVFNQLLLFSEDYWIATLSKSTNTEIEWKFCGLLRHQNLLELVLSELSWTMKSKYFLLCSIVQDSNIPQILSKYGEEIINGLIISLSIPYLVSAGTDLYLALLASLSLKDWQHWFLKPFSKIISHEELSLGMENIFNYWTNQTLKKFPSVFEMLVSETGSSLYSLITLQKIGRKEGLFKWEDLDNQTLEAAMIHHSEKIRSQLFSLVCTCSNNLSPPNNEEVDFAIKFLKQNINSDDSALRQNLLKSLNNLMLRIRDSILLVAHRKDVSNCPFTYNFVNDNPLKDSINFLKWLHSFLLINLEDRCNYQRKITSLEIYKIVFSYLGEDEAGNQYKRKSNNNSFNIRSFEGYSDVFRFECYQDLKALVNCLFHEDNGIRSSAANILISYYNITESIGFELQFQELFDKGIALSKDQMFYKAESGAVIVKVLVSMVYKSSSRELKELINKGSDNFINVLLASAQEQFTQLREDLLKAASQGAFLYGTLQIIELLTSDPADPELSLKDDQQKRLLKLIEEVTDYFVSVLASKSESTSDYAPSFGEMGVAIAAIVEGSSAESSVLCEVATDNTMSDLQLTPAQQLVLNCIWLNLKACTKLCSKLVSSPMNVRDSKRCVSVVVSVLKKCRHKGAIESAGLALYNICSHLTKSDEPELVNLPEELLKDFLQNLIGTTAATVSRRSAGLAILVHRLITGDSRAKKATVALVRLKITISCGRLKCVRTRCPC
ncbi:thyroid adenoma-associated protein homolog isoform X2 [Macrosteles quadrilineatus]|uniref:thyroid adenoma-associated protein homolog isoform X2 n=1 Tax=Macrosteles quadrilineatus TaxID=74068 RepID=UPI0023E0A887|nr:thyroid adenoma-associated protein homolog isoform X2 [Macrosteles quadrilineatus]